MLELAQTSLWSQLFISPPNSTFSDIMLVGGHEPLWNIYIKEISIRYKSGLLFYFPLENWLLNIYQHTCGVIERHLVFVSGP